MLNRSIVFGAGLILSLLPGVAVAQTQPSWQQWAKQNPTYPNAAAASPVPSSTSAASWSSNSGSSGNSTAAAEQLFDKGFMKGCTDKGAPQAYCSCTLESLRSRYSVTQLMDLFTQSNPPLSLIEDIGASCLARTR